MQFICMSVYPKNHKSDDESELRMVPLSPQPLLHPNFTLTLFDPKPYFTLTLIAP